MEMSGIESFIRSHSVDQSRVDCIESASGMLEQIVRNRPFFWKFLQTTSPDLTVGDYSLDLMDGQSKMSPQFLSAFSDTLHRYLPHSELPSILPPVIDTSLHGGILSQPGAVQACLLDGLGARHLDIPVTLALGCGVIPLNNSTWPRGFWTRNQKESIFRNRMDKLLVHFCPPFTHQWLYGEQRHDVDMRRRKWLIDIVESIPGIFDPSVFPTFRSQYTVINHELWSRTAVGVLGLPPMFMLPLEDVTTRLILEDLKHDGWLSYFLSDEGRRAAFLEAFEGVQGAWSGKRGTHLFWGINRKRYQTQLRVSDGRLEGEDNDFVISPDAVIERIEQQTLAPGVLLSLLMLSYHGVHCLGGINQTTYLPHMTSRAARLFASYNLHEESACMSSVPGALLSQGPVVLLDQDVPAGMDTLVTTDAKILSDVFHRNAASRSVINSLLLDLPSLYRDCVTPAEQDPLLRQVQTCNLLQLFG